MIDRVEAMIYDEGLQAKAIQQRLGESRANTLKLMQQARMRRGDLLGHISPQVLRHQWVIEFQELKDLSVEYGCSQIYLRRFLQAHNIYRDQGALHRAGVKPVWNLDKKDPAAWRNRKKAKFMSPEHCEKLAKAKTGRLGEDANHWKGGAYRPGAYVYPAVGGGKNKRYVHRLIAETLLGRELGSDEHVHHMDMNRKNNDPSNLLVLKSEGHLALHRAMKSSETLDQRQWLIIHGIEFEDLEDHAKNQNDFDIASAYRSVTSRAAI